MKIKSFHFYAAVTILFWSLAYVLTRLALPYISVYSLGFLRYLVASCALIPVVVITKMRSPDKMDIKWFLAAGAVGFFIYIIIFNKGCATVTASTSSVVMATVPVITALLARFVYKERLYKFQWAAIAVEFIGVIVLTLMTGAFSMNIGLLWLLLASVLLSIYNLMQKHLTKKYSGLRTSAYSIFAGTAMLFIFLPKAAAEIQLVPPVVHLYIIILGVFSGTIAYVSWSQALARAKQTSSVSNYMFITPFLASTLGFALAGEYPDLPTIIGGSIILMGVFVFNFGGKIGAFIARRKIHGR